MEHRRLFLYRPGVALVIVDRVRSTALHTYTRYLQLAPRLRVKKVRGGSFEIRAPGFEGSVDDAAIGAGAASAAVRGREHPLAGLTSPGFRRFRPRWTLSWADGAATETKAMVISLTDNPLRVVAARRRGRGWEVSLRTGDGATTTLGVRRNGRDLRIDRIDAGGN